MSEIQTPTWNQVAYDNLAPVPDGLPISPRPRRSEITYWGREAMAALKRDWDRSHTTLSSTGSSDAYALTYTVAPPAYANGLRFSFKANFANAGSATCNVNGLGAKTIKKNSLSGLVALTSGDIAANNHVELEYDVAADALVMLNPVGGGAPTAGAGIAVSGSTVSMAPTGLTAVTPAAGDYFVISDVSDSGNPKKALVSDIPATIAGAGLAASGGVLNSTLDYCIVTMSADQTGIGVGTTTKVNFDTTQDGHNSAYVDATNKRFKPTVASTWIILTYIQPELYSPNNGYQYAWLRKNGSNLGAGRTSNPYNAGGFGMDTITVPGYAVAFNGSSDYADVAVNFGTNGTSGSYNIVRAANWLGSGKSQMLCLRIA